MVKGHETPGGRKTPGCGRCGHVSHSIVKVRFSPLAPLVLLSPLGCQEGSFEGLWSVCPHNPACLYVSSPGQASRLHFMELPATLLSLRSPSQFRVSLFHISASQQLARRGASTSPQDSPAAATAPRDSLPALGSELSGFDLLSIHLETRSRQQWSHLLPSWPVASASFLLALPTAWAAPPILPGSNYEKQT